MTMIYGRPMNKEFIAGGKKFVFPFVVITYVLLDDKMMVCSSWSKLKEALPNIDENRAIWCYDLEGNLLWQVENPKFKLANGIRIQECFISVYGVPETGVIIGRGQGYEFEIDPKTGNLSNPKAIERFM